MTGHPPSPAEQDYLKQIYLQQEETGRASTQDLATRLGVKPSSVTAMLKHLADDPAGPYVRHTPYRGVELTDKGAAVALKMLRLHRLIELFLAELLELPWDQLHAEAERLEHVLSENLEERIAAKLGNPTHDPHGDPIPGPDGWMPPPEGVALCTLEPGTDARVVRVPDGNPGLLQYLSSLGLVPGVLLHVEAVAPFGDVITVRIAEATQVVGSAVAGRILVCPIPTQTTPCWTDEDTER
jgi:DtxR family Mn-dependent transcriptional regulator